MTLGTTKHLSINLAKNRDLGLRGSVAAPLTNIYQPLILKDPHICPDRLCTSGWWIQSSDRQETLIFIFFGLSEMFTTALGLKNPSFRPRSP